MADNGRAPSGQALVASDGAATHLHPTGFDPSRECNILDKAQQVCPRHGHSHAPLCDQTLYAWTSVGDYKSYPQFVNVSLKGGRVRVIVRSLETIDPDKGWPVTGAWAEAVIPDDEVGQFADAFSRAASAIKARSANDSEAGMAEGESAGPKDDARLGSSK